MAIDTDRRGFLAMLALGAASAPLLTAGDVAAIAAPERAKAPLRKLPPSPLCLQVGDDLCVPLDWVTVDAQPTFDQFMRVRGEYAYRWSGDVHPQEAFGEFLRYYKQLTDLCLPRWRAACQRDARIVGKHFSVPVALVELGGADLVPPPERWSPDVGYPHAGPGNVIGRYSVGAIVAGEGAHG